MLFSFVMNCRYVNFIIFSMSAEPLYLICFKFKYYPGNQPVLITHNIKHHPVILDQTGMTLNFFKFIKVFEIRFQ